MAFVLQHRIPVYPGVRIFRENRTQQMQISLQLSGAVCLSLWDSGEAKKVCRAYFFFLQQGNKSNLPRARRARGGIVKRYEMNKMI